MVQDEQQAGQLVVGIFTWSGLASLLLAQELQDLGPVGLVFLLVLLEVDAEKKKEQIRVS